MAVVAAFKTLASTTDSGLVAYFRATGCTAITIADVIPLLSKITVYANEYVIGEMKIWDSGSESSEPNNCAMVRVMVYNDGWIVAWFDEETQEQISGPNGASWVDAQTINIGDVFDYDKQINGMLVEITNSNGAGADDPECPDGTIFCIRNFDWTTKHLQVHEDRTSNAYHFNTGNTYDLKITQSNGNLVWWGHTSDINGYPTNLANRLYRAIYEMWENLRYSSNATDTTDTAITKAFLDDGGSFTDYTTEFNNATVNDVPLIPATEVVNDAFYYGSANKFNGLTLNVGTAGVGNTIVWEYWDGSAWSSLTVTDLTSGFTVAGSNTVKFTPPDAWTESFVNLSEQFWIRSRVSVAAFTTQPLLTQGWVIVSDALAYSDSNLGMYSFEDTSALYCLICGISKYQHTTPDDYYYYNTCLLGKVIYHNSINYGANTQSGQYQSYCYFTINSGNKITLIAGNDSNGFIIENAEDIDTDAGSQNVFNTYVYCNGYGASKVYINFASVLITS